MAKENIYGPDLSEHEQEGAEIAVMGLRCMQAHGSTEKAAESDGDSVSKSELEKFKPSKA